jgi:hypothetical protein
MNRGLISFCSIILLLNAIGNSSQIVAQESKSAQEDDIREAVLRFQMQNWTRESHKDEAAAKDQSEKEIAHALNFVVFFVSTGKKDPSDEFVKRFDDIARTVKKESSAEISSAVRMPVVDKETQKRGIIFSTGNIHWLGNPTSKWRVATIAMAFVGLATRSTFFFVDRQEAENELDFVTRCKWGVSESFIASAWFAANLSEAHDDVGD